MREIEYTQMIHHALEESNPELLPEKPVFNSVIKKYVAHHKLIERRMDGSSGGVFGAIVETVARENYYFSGTVVAQDFSVHHIITNNPEDIVNMSGYHPTKSECYNVFPPIKELLESGEKVLFCGTPIQCEALKQFVKGYEENLVTIDIICQDPVSKYLISKYVENIEKVYQSPVGQIRFYNKEFHNEDSKRIHLIDGRLVYTDSSDIYEQALMTGKYTKKTFANKYFDVIGERVGDITIGAYDLEEDNDGLGYTYISVNTQKGINLIEKTRKRLEIVRQGDTVKELSIKYRTSPSVEKLNEDELCKSSLQEVVKLTKNPSFLNKIKTIARPFVSGFNYAQKRPLTYWKFVKLNFFTKGVHTNFGENGFVYVSPFCEFKLRGDFNIELHGPLYIGERRIPFSREETRLRMEDKSRLIVHHKSGFGAGSNVEIYKNARLEIGSLSSNAEFLIICGEYIKLGYSVNLARGCSIRDTSGHMLAIHGYKMKKPVEIGNHVWICSDSTIMPGVKIGDGAVVGASSFVTKKVRSLTMVQGNPAVEVSGLKYFRM